MDVDTDVARFHRALEKHDLEAALRLCRGRFLDGFDERRVGTDLEAWIFETREREAERLRHALIADACTRAAAGEVGDPAGLAARAFDLPGAAPTDPPALLELHALLVAGGHPLARQVASDAAELGLDLGRVGPGAYDRPAAAARQLWSGTPLVGRVTELEQALALVSDPSARIVTLAGRGGVGKTRLALELTRRLEEAGGTREGLPVAGPVALESVRAVGQLLREMTSAHRMGQRQVVRWRLDCRFLRVADAGERGGGGRRAGRYHLGRGELLDFDVLVRHPQVAARVDRHDKYPVRSRFLSGDVTSDDVIPAVDGGAPRSDRGRRVARQPSAP